MESLPDAFVNRMKEQLGTEAEDFFIALAQPSPTSIRLNHFKGLSSYTDMERVPWCDLGYYLQSRPRFQLDPHWHGGAYYVQEPSSMILDDVIQQLSLDQRPRIWLDLCAAPGGKTGILAKHLNTSDILIANEVIQQRRTILWENLVKGGYINTMITGEQSSSFNQPLADIILIDAPCAGEGMMRKETEAIEQWSPVLVNSCSTLQKQIVSDVARALKPGGFLIYSTCSYSHAENMNNVSHFVNHHDLESMPLTFPEEWRITKMEDKNVFGYQLFPHKVRGEGLFISVLKNISGDQFDSKSVKYKSSEFIPVHSFLEHAFDDPSKWKIRKNNENHSIINAAAEQKANEVLQKFPRAEIIANAGQVKGKDYIPSHFLAMSGVQNSSYPKIELELHSALDYLERATTLDSRENKNGWYLIQYENTCLGWAKRTPQGWKNHYPMNWRLRSRKA